MLASGKSDFRGPVGMVLDAAGNLHVSDQVFSNNGGDLAEPGSR